MAAARCSRGKPWVLVFMPMLYYPQKPTQTNIVSDTFWDTFILGSGGSLRPGGHHPNSFCGEAHITLPGFQVHWSVPVP